MDTPQQLNTYRRSTDSMVGATVVPTMARCVCCGKMRTASTGKETKAGWRCNWCGKKK